MPEERDPRYVATSAVFICKCKKSMMIRSQQKEVIKRCQCGKYSIKFVLGLGKGNYSAHLIDDSTGAEERIRAKQFDQ